MRKSIGVTLTVAFYTLVSAGFAQEFDPPSWAYPQMDEGRGLGPDREPGADGVGLGSIRGRTEEIGGRYELHSSPSGTVVSVLLPVAT